MMAGGKNAAHAVTDKGREIALHHKDAIEAQAGGAGTCFEPISQRTQVVAGTNYYIKIKTGEGKYVHAKFWHKLDNTSQLSEVTANKSEADEL